MIIVTYATIIKCLKHDLNFHLVGCSNEKVKCSSIAKSLWEFKNEISSSLLINSTLFKIMSL